MDGRVRGIDVSHNNGTVNWDQLAPAGISFAFAKASQGVHIADPQFATNWAAMKDAGVLRGAYHFIGFPQATTPQSSWNDDMHGQIDHFLSLMGTPQAGDLPPMLDLEDGDSPARRKALIASDRSAALALIAETINYLTTQLGSFWSSELGDPTADEMSFGNYPWWLAQYPIGVHPAQPISGPPGSTDQGEAGSFDEYDAALSGHTPRHIPQVWGGQAAPVWKIWQFSEFGKIPAIASGFIDLDVFNGSADDLNALVIPAPSA
jgi:lysozyme